MSWTQLRVRGGDPAAVASVLFSAGAQALQEDGDALVTSFPPETDLANVYGRLRSEAAGAEWEASEVAPVDWSVAWRENAQAHDVGALTIAPPWLTEGLDPVRTLVIDPGMAFGTGAHASTRGALRLLQRLLRPGIVVADLGAGSAILSVAAARLGASNVFAIEVDADALGNAAENVHRNQVGDIVHLFEGDATILLPLVAPVDLIVANIISSVLVELLPAMQRALPRGGGAVLAGILVEEREVVRDAILVDGWRVDAEDIEEAWWSVAIIRP